jgi:hypothetical protein
MLITENQLRKIIRQEIFEDYSSISLLEKRIEKELLLNEIRAIKNIAKFTKQKFNSINNLRKKLWQFGLDHGIKISFFLAFLDLYVYLSKVRWLTLSDDFPELNLITGGGYTIIGIISLVEKYYEKLEKDSTNNKKAKKVLDEINEKFEANRLVKKSKKLLELDEYGNFVDPD